MKANELMTGDLVLYGGKPTRVLQLEEGKDYKNAINPIPLTVEILKKNGFREYDNYGYAGNKGYCCDDFYINHDFTFRVEMRVCKINYVHELQHALIFVGMGDIAENLKI